MRAQPRMPRRIFKFRTLATRQSRPLATLRRFQPKSTKAQNPTHQRTINRLLRELGGAKEVQQYLGLYSSFESQQFAVIKVGGGVLQNELDELVSSLSFLHSVGLYPIVVHGAGPQMNARLKAEGIESDYINGNRISTPDIIRIANEVFQSENAKLVRALEERGTRARPIASGVFQAVQSNPSLGLGLVGSITDVNINGIQHAIEEGYLPVLTCMAQSKEGQLLNVNADIAARELAKAIQPHKMVYISYKGGLLDDGNALITNIDLKTDYDALMNAPWFQHGDRLKLNEIQGLLQHLPSSSSVAITSAAGLASELFTHKGSGTLIQTREVIERHTTLEGLNTARMKQLVEKAFDAELDPGYWDSIQHRIHAIYLSRSYRGVAILLKDPDDPDAPPLMDKFCVVRQSQSEGIGNRIWELLKKDTPSMWWRARSNNPINTWYFERSDGSFKVPLTPWTVFWFGIGQPVDTLPLIERGASIPPSILKKPSVALEDATPSTTDTALHPTRAVRVGLVGARGFTGQEIIRILARHPSLKLRVASSRQLKGKLVNECFQEADTADLRFVDLQPEHMSRHMDVDVWILALPNGLAKPFADEVASHQKIIDLSADFRFSPKCDAADANAEQLLRSGRVWQYGLPERRGQKSFIRMANRVANPGCYATGTQLSLLPLLDREWEGATDIGIRDTPAVFGVSGYSGAGTTPSRKNDPEALHDNLMPYALTGHVHEKECSFQMATWLPEQRLTFTPHVASWFQGIHLTTRCHLSPTQAPVTRDQIVKQFEEYYAGQQLVHVTADIPEVAQVSNTPHAIVGGFGYDADSHTLVLTTVLDNLLKGAATQCCQNLNLMLGVDEYAGLLE